MLSKVVFNESILSGFSFINFLKVSVREVCDLSLLVNEYIKKKIKLKSSEKVD